MMWWGHGFDGFGWGWMLLGGLMMLLFWGGVIALLVVAARAFLSSQRSSNAAGPSVWESSSALDILKERFARGEITREEYELMKQDVG